MLLHFQRKALTLVFNSTHSWFQPSFQISLSFVCFWILCLLPVSSHVPLAFLSHNFVSSFYFLALKVYLFLLSYLKRNSCVAFIWDTFCVLPPKYYSDCHTLLGCLLALSPGWLWYLFSTHHVLSRTTVSYMCVWSYKVLDIIDVFLYLSMCVCVSTVRPYFV